jgi:hypothetical protein
LFAGATQVTLACPLPAVATTEVGAPETLTGLTAVEGVDEIDDPLMLVATPEKV